MKEKIKLFLLILVSSSMLIYAKPWLILLVGIFALVLLFICNAQGRFIVWLKPLLFVFLIVILLRSFTLFPFSFSIEGFYLGLLYATRLVSLVALVFLFVQTSSINQLAQAFSFLPGSLPQLLTLTLSLLPNMVELAEKIIWAQKSRGLSFRSFNIFKTYFPVLIPLFARTLQRSEHMSLAMQARGFKTFS